jgi:hypothetical protein
LAYLESWHETSTNNQKAAGVEVDLPFQDFLDLFGQDQLNSLQRAIDADRIRYQMDADNKFAFVLSWKSYSHRSSNKMNKDTAIICSRMKSAAINLPQAGDKLREAHKKAISESLTGLEKTDDHKKAIGEANKGKAKEPWSDERKEARRNLLAQKKATKSEARKAAEDAAWARLKKEQGDA